MEQPIEIPGFFVAAIEIQEEVQTELPRLPQSNRYALL